MGSASSLNRVEAARWCSKVTRYKLSHATLSYWEANGLLRSKGRGRRVPTTYTVEDLVRLRVLTELRRDGAPLQRVRRVLANLARFLPGVIDRPGAWRLAVTSTGDVARVQNPRQLMELTDNAGQLSWFAVFDANTYVRDAQTAIERAA